MKAIFLAAGVGSRLKPLTDTLPKCMVEIHGKPILQYGIEAMNNAGINNVVVIRGYLPDKINFTGVRYLDNKNYAETNMVETLFCAIDELDSDIIVSYSDIIYTPSIVRKLIKAQCDVGVVIDRKWYQLWSLRMDDPLMDVETLKINPQGYIKEIGKKALSYGDIDGQYVGLIKLSKNFIPTLKSFYYGLDRNDDYEGKDFRNMFMTTFLQLMIDAGYSITAVPVDGGWIEVDTYSDYVKYSDSRIFSILFPENYSD